MTEVTKAPKKAIDVTIHVDGFTWEEIFEGLQEQIQTLAERKERAGGFVVRPGFSATTGVETRKVTKQEYLQEIREHHKTKGVAS